MTSNIPKPLDVAAATDQLIANTIRKAAGLDYQSRIPKATQANIQDVVDSLDSYEPDWNTFINVLLNGLVLDLFRTNDFTNPLGRFKLAGVVDNGTWIRELGYGLIKAKHYDKYATDVFSVDEPEVHVNYHVQNRRDRYDLTISEDILRQAMLAPGDSIANQINQMLALPYTSAEQDEYLIMRNLLAQRDESSPYWNKHIEDISTGTRDERQSKMEDVAQFIRKAVLDWKFLHTQYNPEGLPSKSDNPILLATPDFVSNMDVRLLAWAFNQERADVLGNVQLVDSIPLDGVSNSGNNVILADPGIFVAADTKLKSVSIYNPKNDSTNYFLHRWGIYSISKMVNAMLFSDRADSTEEVTVRTVDSVTVSFAPVNGTTPKFAIRGTSTQLQAAVTGTNNPSDAVDWQIIGDSGDIKSTNTYIKGDGSLWVGTDEKNTYLVIRATSLVDRSKSDTIKVGINEVAPDIDAITKVEVTGEAAPTPGSNTNTYAAVVTGDASNNVIWNVYGGTTSATKITTAGKLTVGSSEPANTKLTIVATSRLNPTVSGSLEVTVTA